MKLHNVHPLTHGRVPANRAGTIAKYFATSLATEKVSTPAGHEQLLANLDDLNQLVGSESRSTMFPALLQPESRSHSQPYVRLR